MRDGFAFTLLLMRTGAAIFLTLGLAEAFQGLLLSTLAYLFTVHAADRAEATVIAEKRKRTDLEGLTRTEAEGVEDLKRGLERALRTLRHLEADPAIGRRVQELSRRLSDEDQP